MSKVDVVTFGCRLNSYESEVIRKTAAEDGLDNAIIFNTCAVTGEAVRQARQAIRRARKENPDARLIVTGCAAQTDPDTFANMTEVDFVIGNADKQKAGAYRLTPDSARVVVNDVFSVKTTAGHLIDGLKDRARAFVEVQNGCDHRCTFCIIPYGRGNSRSAAAGDVISQTQTLVAQGYNEIVLTGVDLTSWGGDLPGNPQLGHLVTRILKHVPDLKRLRLSSIDAAEIDDTLLRAFAEEERLAPYLHLSLQHGDDMILKRMKRRHLRADAIALVEKVRRARPDISFGADMIAGFPTETEDMFANAVSLVDACDLSFVHVFPYSPRPQTPAAKMPQLPRPLIKERAARLRTKAEEALTRHLTRQHGRVLSCVVEKPGFARAADFTEVVFDGDAMVGGLSDIRIHGHDGKHVIGTLAQTQLQQAV
ncbi:tRNA (N(6)-L-threonylcarbamoyladenosine(37)-C(2))-methylthiotransferase MtaB [Asticcacaulis sp. 201]|uniref:tRNA (N(6)-L-threonylcarbamoyladenosine(37)-C(2))- methylthiotransferase MtaB n=1 Tax=Asticcacaulis sp. 201 TaxID=3028787 RepID=UPI002916D313|nr:tRNA (N(6)-L-threonylcarbamoyladenosine(37)-C(2))-methylthiotransferase MtaB [Asticcacaulis sp. 201]MDV6332094.1 tRNA (N(6)-L-threonylcarbamoyladenosine(37)-C(2))-methylthiotransferase MtaB [Asticcacaulis sp. 201]